MINLIFTTYWQGKKVFHLFFANLYFLILKEVREVGTFETEKNIQPAAQQAMTHVENSDSISLYKQNLNSKKFDKKSRALDYPHDLSILKTDCNKFVVFIRNSVAFVAHFGVMNASLHRNMA